MDVFLETPVTISCDNPRCPAIELTLARTLDTGDLAEVRRRALNIAVDNVTAAGWSVHFMYGPTFDAFIASAYCPLHRAARAWML